MVSKYMTFVSHGQFIRTPGYFRPTIYYQHARSCFLKAVTYWSLDLEKKNINVP